jgi:hypothetical protein
MKIRDYHSENRGFARITRLKHIGSFERISRAFPRASDQMNSKIRTLSSHFFIWIGIGFFTFAPLTLAHGTAGGHSGSIDHGNGSRNDHHRYFNPFWSPSLLYRTGIYDSAYCYTPTMQQQATAKQQVEAYLSGVKKNHKPVATHRYISVETLRPTKD